MSKQFLLTIDLPRLSLVRSVPVATLESVAARAAAPAWPPEDGVQRRPALQGTWKVQDDRLALVWA